MPALFLRLKSEVCGFSINAIAQKEGVEKAKPLSAACLEQGYDKAMNNLQKAGDAIKEKLFGEKK